MVSFEEVSVVEVTHGVQVVSEAVLSVPEVSEEHRGAALVAAPEVDEDDSNK